MKIVNVTLMVSVLSFIVTVGRAQSQPKAKPLETATVSEGMHDFDFEAGEWVFIIASKGRPATGS